MKTGKQLLRAKITCGLTPDDVRKLPAAQQADAIHEVLGGATDALGDLGFDLNVIAHVTWDLAHELVNLDGGPPKVFRADQAKKA
jgi:hypothetical protein